MASSDNISMAVFCDFENVALGVRDANYEKFDIKPVLERLLLKGSIVVKKAYCDWDRYKGFKSTMHEANFELIEIPHVRQSGKNSADIRLVVDALDLCYTKSHVNTFVIISGDSDFSPLVSKLRENAKQVIGVGVKQSTSDLLVANCDEFIFYDDLVREVRRAAAKRKEELDARKAAPQKDKRPGDDRRKEELEARKNQALEMVVETFDALVSERGDTGKIWASLLKDTLKRRRPEFSEVYYGFRTFGNLLEEAQVRGLFEFGRDEKSGTYVYRSSADAPAALAEAPLEAAQETAPGAPVVAEGGETGAAPVEAKEEGKGEGRRRGGRGRNKTPRGEPAFVAVTPDEAGKDALPADAEPAEQQGDAPPTDTDRTWPAPEEVAATTVAVEASEVAEAVEASEATDVPAPAETPAPETPKPALKERRRTPRKPAARKAAASEAPAVTTTDVADVLASGATPSAQVPVPAPAAADAGMGQDGVADAVVVADVAGMADGAEGTEAPAATPARRKPSREPARKAAARARRPAKPKTPPDGV